jgi:2-oxoglutarate dehydrogenase E1 component
MSEERLRGRAAALAENMSRSLSVPTATTIREFSVGPFAEWRLALKAQGSPVPVISCLAYALVSAIKQDVPAMRCRLELRDDAFWKVDDGQINLGIAVDVSSGDNRSVMVPVVHGADQLSFAELNTRISQLAEACRSGTINVSDLKGANVMLTSTGRFGATGGVPRLPIGPGCIIAAGSIGIPPGLEALAESMPIQPVLMMTSTYDHRIIQGSESGELLSGLVRRLQDPAFLDEMTSAQPARNTPPQSGLKIDLAANSSVEAQKWLKERSSYSTDSPSSLIAERLSALQFLVELGVFERYLQKQFLGLKTLSAEGLDSSILAVAQLARLCATDDGKSVHIGMAHRGRLAVMALVLQWSMPDLLQEFLPNTSSGPDVFTGDVRQHLGGSGRFKFDEAGEIEVVLEQNPSHLEFVGPVSLGGVRAEQDLLVSAGESKSKAQHDILPLVLHGDASFTGQGVVYETFNFSKLDPYQVGGVIHIVQDNQLGFTATPDELRSTRWPSDVVLGFEIPVIHVNADDVDSVLSAAKLAFQYRNEFESDVVLHVLGYRRHGHNEADEPRYTQPLQYQEIDQHERVDSIYARKLLGEELIDSTTQQGFESDYHSRLRAAQEVANQASPITPSIARAAKFQLGRNANTQPLKGYGSKAELITALKDAYTSPTGFQVNTKLQKQFLGKIKGLEEGNPLDWAQAELLALELIAGAGVPVRLTGEDTLRGTFSQRHLVLHDSNSAEKYQRFGKEGTDFYASNSPLTETATLAFEYGYARQRTEALVLWEAQFGDFVNVAQVIIDQFISAGRQKWLRDGRLVMLLPHGWEGAGPEHSSARLERFLQLAANGNLRILYPTTSHQYFCALIEAAFLEVQPHIIMTPKSMLRAEMAASALDLFTTDVRYRPVLADGCEPNVARRIVLCSGKIGAELASRPLPEEIRVIRLEELYPFPEAELRENLSGALVREVVWLQEEPENMGAWRYLSLELLKRRICKTKLGYVGRPEASSPAEGYPIDHKGNQERILSSAVGFGEADFWLVD